MEKIVLQVTLFPVWAAKDLNLILDVVLFPLYSSYYSITFAQNQTDRLIKLPHISCNKSGGKWEDFEDTKVVIRIRTSKKNGQQNGQKKKDKQRSAKHTHKTKDRITRTPLKTVNSGAPEG
jgi:hypothetical protein